MSPPADELRCDAVLEQIEPLIDDELDAETVQRIRRHLEVCSSCAKETAAAREILDELRSLPEYDLPPAVMDRVRTIIDDDSVKDLDFARTKRRMEWMAAAAAVVIAIGALTFSRQQSDAIDPAALRAAADVKIALACVGDITRRANRAIRSEVIDNRVVPVAARGLTRPFLRLTNDRLLGGSGTPPPDHLQKGDS